MPTRPDVITELRSLFRQGATPSRLLEFIRDSHPGEGNWFLLAGDYFAEAFAVPFVRVTNNPDDYSSPGLRHAHLNGRLLHQMIQNRPLWDDRQEASPWLDFLTASDEATLETQAKVAVSARVGDISPPLDPAVLGYLQQTTAQVAMLHERVQILARLAESLQRQIPQA